MAGIDLNRTSAGVSDLLPRDISQEIWGSAVESSVVMQLSRRINLPASGLTIPIITGDPEAGWVNETDEKPVSDSTVGSKNIRGYKLAVIETFSDEFRRDLPALYAELARRLPFALARKFDQTVLHGTAPGTDFDVLSDVAAVTLDATDTAGDVFNAYTTVAANGGQLNGWALSPQAQARLMTSKDSAGSYLFQNSLSDSPEVGRVLGQPVYSSNAVYAASDVDSAEVLGVAGDWTGALVGVISDVAVSISDTATVNKGGTQLNLWQRNMFAIRAEFEVGFAVKDKANFVRLTGAAAGA